MERWAVTDSAVKEICLRRWNVVAKRTGQYWTSPCPQCGGTDRFRVYPSGYFQCRPLEGHCGMTGWLDDDRPFQPDPTFALRLAQDRAAEEAKRLQKSEDWKDGYRAGYYRGYHDALKIHNRRWWYGRGVTDYEIDYYGLGFLQDKRVETPEGKLVESPAYTIPCFDPRDWKVRNIHYRLVNPPPEVKGKYRYEAGIPQWAFYAEPTLEGDAIVVEGAIKAMVVKRFLGGDLQVVGLPCCDPSVEVKKELQGFKRIWLALDPGCRTIATQMRKEYLPQARLVELLDKPDDLVLAGHDLKAYLKQAR